MLALFCAYWSGRAREGNTDARLVTNSLQSDVIVKRPRRWIMRYILFTFISNRKFRSIPLVRTRAILSKLPVPIIFLRSRRLGCITQKRLPFLFANRCIWILLQIPDMVDIISSWSILEWIRKNWRCISMKFNGYRLVSSTNRSHNLVLLRPRTHSLLYFSAYVAVSLWSLTDMMLWTTWEFWIVIILSWSWRGRLRHRKSGVYCRLLYSTSCSWSISAFQLPSSVTPSWEQSSFGILPKMTAVMRSFVPTKNWVLTVRHIAFLSSIANNTTFWSDMSNCIILRRLRSLSVPSLHFFVGSFILLAGYLLLSNFLIQQFDVIRAIVKRHCL